MQTRECKIDNEKNLAAIIFILLLLWDISLVPFIIKISTIIDYNNILANWDLIPIIFITLFSIISTFAILLVEKEYLETKL